MLLDEVRQLHPLGFSLVVREIAILQFRSRDCPMLARDLLPKMLPSTIAEAAAFHTKDNRDL